MNDEVIALDKGGTKRFWGKILNFVNQAISTDKEKISDKIFSKSSNIISANVNGVVGSEIPRNIPEEYRPDENVFLFVLVRSTETMRYFMGYLKFYSDGLVEGGVFADYGTNVSVGLFENKYLVYGSTTWFI